MGEGKEILKFEDWEDINMCTECTCLGTKIDQSGDNTTEKNTELVKEGKL